MKLKHKIHCVIAVSVMVYALSLNSCKKFVQVPSPPNYIISSDVFKDSSDVQSAVIGLYLQMDNNYYGLGTFNGNLTLYPGLSSDELYSNTGSSSEMSAYLDEISASDGQFDLFWSDSYSLIYKCNAIVEGLSGSNNLTVSAKNQFLGEALTIRAFCYFYLVNLYGPVPLETSTDYKVNAVMARTPVNAVYTQIITDLTSAEKLLAANYPTNGRVRINKYAAMALLSRVYLYNSQWANAYTVSTQIINSGTYTLEPNLNNVFLAESSEAIFQLQSDYPGEETAEGNTFVPSDPTSIPSYGISNFLLNAFEPGDKRRTNWIDSSLINNNIYYYPYKYKLISDNNTSPLEDDMIFRLAEQYLIRSEAEAEGGGNGLAAAITDLNVIRRRAGLGNTTATSKDDVLAAIQRERRVELFCEWGHRWFDLKRTGTINAVMGGSNGECAAKGGTWSPNWQLYPIFIQQIQNNRALVQNPGY